ncbi:MAG TPA: alanine--glyoxylate aminotransferase family protein [Gemmatimonadaceae bacterium]|nr:alanine--glyoxylate aminotransferase family protein [Gemmatimonadaceae bacterium]
MTTAIPAPSDVRAQRAPGFGRFFLPGPTEVLPAVLQAMTRPMIGHRGKDIEGLLAAIQPALQAVFRTQRPVYISTSSATGLMEAAVRNGARKRVLSLVNGAFSERFYRISLACGLETDKLEAPLGNGFSAEQLADALRGKDYDAVTVVHSETATGALNPIEQLAKAAHAAGDVVLLVDSVSGMAGARVETDGWGLDYVLTGAQKAFALPPGVAFCSASENVLERAKQKKDRGIYFDLIEFDKYIRKNQTPNTPAVSLLYALQVQLEHIQSEGIENRWKRHQAMAERTWRWVDEMRERGVGIAVLAPVGYRSPTVTCIRVPEGKTGSAINSAMKAIGFVIAPGYGNEKDLMIRIGHMGEHTVEELDVLLEALGTVLLA